MKQKPTKIRKPTAKAVPTTSEPQSSASWQPFDIPALSDIPLPQNVSRHPDGATPWEQIRDIATGQSVFYPGREHRTIMCQLTTINRYAGKTFRCRPFTHEGKIGVMVWRVA